jgi:hypothetical protein
MADALEPLIVDLLEWIGPHSRAYAEVMEVWRTSCPRLPVWEEANARGYLAHLHVSGEPLRIGLTERGAACLAARQTLSRDHPTWVGSGPATSSDCAFGQNC